MAEEKLMIDVSGLVPALTEKISKKLMHDIARRLDAEIQRTIQAEVTKYIEQHVLPEVQAVLAAQRETLIKAAVAGVGQAVGDVVGARVKARLINARVLDELIDAIGGRR